MSTERESIFCLKSRNELKHPKHKMKKENMQRILPYALKYQENQEKI